MVGGGLTGSVEWNLSVELNLPVQWNGINLSVQWNGINLSVQWNGMYRTYPLVDIKDRHYSIQYHRTKPLTSH